MKWGNVRLVKFIDIDFLLEFDTQYVCMYAYMNTLVYFSEIININKRMACFGFCF